LGRAMCRNPSMETVRGESSRQTSGYGGRPLAHNPRTESAPQHCPGANDRLRRVGMMTQLGTMLLRRVRIGLRAGLPALQRRLPEAWEVHPDSREVSQGANLAVLFYEIFLNQTAEGPQLTTADAVGRYFVLGIPSRHRQTEETAFMVFRILTAHPTGENPFGWKGVAAGKTTGHANIVR